MSELLRKLRAWWRSILPTTIRFEDEPPAWINTAAGREAWKVAQHGQRRGVPVRWESD